MGEEDNPEERLRPSICAWLCGSKRMWTWSTGKTVAPPFGSNAARIGLC
jgi:hypothetical protein